MFGGFLNALKGWDGKGASTLGWSEKGVFIFAFSLIPRPLLDGAVYLGLEASLVLALAVASTWNAFSFLAHVLGGRISFPYPFRRKGKLIESEIGRRRSRLSHVHNLLNFKAKGTDRRETLVRVIDRRRTPLGRPPLPFFSTTGKKQFPERSSTYSIPFLQRYIVILNGLVFRFLVPRFSHQSY